MSKLYQELWLARKVTGIKMQTLFQGLTDISERRRRMRGGILAGGLRDILAGKDRNGCSRTFRECFETIYGEPL